MAEIILSIGIKNQLALGKNEFSISLNSEEYKGEFETEEGGGMLFKVYQQNKSILLYTKRLRLPFFKTFLMRRHYEVYHKDRKLCDVRWGFCKRRLIIKGKEYRFPSLKKPAIPECNIFFPRSFFLKPMVDKLTVNVDSEDKNKIWLGTAITCIVGLKRCFIASE